MNAPQIGTKGSATMAKKKSESVSPDSEPKRRGPKPDPSRVRSATTIIRSMPAWKEWIEEFAEFDRCSSVSELLDRALVSYARDAKFPKPAPKR